MLLQEVRTTHTFVKKTVIRSLDATNACICIPWANFTEPKIGANVLEYIDVQKHIKPSTYASAIQPRLLSDGVVQPNDLPGTSQFNQVRIDLSFNCTWILLFYAYHQGNAKNPKSVVIKTFTLQVRELHLIPHKPTAHAIQNDVFDKKEEKYGAYRKRTTTSC